MVFSVVMAHAATAFDYNFHPWATKIMDLETVFLSVIPDYRKSRKCAKVGPERLPKFKKKSIKTDIWASVCPLSVPKDPRITKMVPEVPKMEPQGLQNNEFANKKRPIAAINLSAAASCQGDSFPVISSPSVCNYQFASLVSAFSCLLLAAGGPAAGGEALRFAPTL